jgi:hypothetical protein
MPGDRVGGNMVDAGDSFMDGIRRVAEDIGYCGEKLVKS